METSIRGLLEAVMSELQRLHYTKGTISQYRTAYRKYERFTLEQGTISHSVELGARWLQEGCGIDIRLLQNNKSLVISPVPSARKSLWVHRIV